MIDGLIYSPKEKIPLFKLRCDSSGIRSVEYLNKRTGCTDCMKVSKVVTVLLEAEGILCEKGIMLYSPNERIPIGVLVKNQQGDYYLEVKYKKHKERIRISTHVSLMLETDALKVS